MVNLTLDWNDVGEGLQLLIWNESINLLHTLAEREKYHQPYAISKDPRNSARCWDLSSQTAFEDHVSSFELIQVGYQW